MAINKVEANGETLIDLTSDTVTADTLVSGRTAHLASGAQVTGTFEPVTGVKGNAESAYRKGNVNLTPANIGAATSAQGAKADSAVQTIQIGGTVQAKTNGTVNLPAYPTKSSLGLGNVDNTSDANKPISTAAQAEFDKQQAQIDKALEQTGYNLLEITSTTQTTSGVTFTVNKAAGTIRADGTATADIYYNISVPSNVYGNICLSGCPSGGGNTTYDVFPRDNTAGARPKKWNGKTTAESIYSENQWAEVKYVQGHSNLIQIRIRSGVTVSNLVFKPMIVPSELAGVPFQPYAMSNAELTQKVEDISDCLYINAYNTGSTIIIQNASDFTLNLFTKFSTADQIPKFAFLKLMGVSTTQYLRAMINVKVSSSGTTIDVAFTDGITLYKFYWDIQSGTVGTPTITAKTLSFA